MTQHLSPGAQAVAWAYDNTPERPTGNHRYHWLAAALRAVADQVTSEFYDPPRKDGDRYIDGMADGKILRNGDIRAALLAIAAELEKLDD
jgi:hypothetical protein